MRDTGPDRAFSRRNVAGGLPWHSQTAI